MLARFNFCSGVTVLVATLREDLRVLCSYVERNLNVYRSEKMCEPSAGCTEEWYTNFIFDTSFLKSYGLAIQTTHYTLHTTVFTDLGSYFLIVKLTLNNEGNMLLRNVDNFLPDDVPSHPRYRNLLFRSYLLKTMILKYRAYTKPPVWKTKFWMLLDCLEKIFVLVFHYNALLKCCLDTNVNRFVQTLLGVY